MMLSPHCGDRACENMVLHSQKFHIAELGDAGDPASVTLFS